MNFKLSVKITFTNGIPIKFGIEALHRTCKARVDSAIYKPRKKLRTRLSLGLHMDFGSRHFRYSCRGMILIENYSCIK